MSAILHIEPPPGCTVRILSDLHLAHPRSSAPSPRQLVESMSGVDMLILAGDTAETRLTSPERDRSMQCRDELRALCHQRGLHLVELSGNHDPDVDAQLALLWNAKVAVMHGHALLPCISPWSREFFACAAEVKRMIASRPLAAHHLEERLLLARDLSHLLGLHVPTSIPSPASFRLLREAYYCFWPPQRPLHILAAWLSCGRRAQAFCNRFLPSTNLLVIGHFHRPGQWRSPHRRIFSTGAWFQHASPFAVDLRDARLLRYAPWNANLTQE